MLRGLRNRITRASSSLLRAAPATALSAPWRGRRREFETLEPRLVLDAGPFVISEFMAFNDSGLTDRDDEFSDWIEIYNPTAATESLDGWYLTDDDNDLDKWQFPDVSIDSGKYLVVFASDKNLTDPAGELHTNFQIDGDGEYLALVQPDGTTIAQHFAPEFPRQDDDISYGVSQQVLTLVSDEQTVRYRVPTAADDPTSWTTLVFDDSAWSRGGAEPTLLITEIGYSTPDYVEIQNVSDHPIDATGWVVAANKGTSQDINQFHKLWELDGPIAPGEVLYRTDDPTENYFGEGINWSTGGKGWAMIVDNRGIVADFAPWSYSADDIAELNTVIGGFPIRGSSAFSGDALPVAAGMVTMQRLGDTDHDDMTDFAFVPPAQANRGFLNPQLTLPVTSARMPGVGFSTEAPGFGGMLQADVTTEMFDTNASLWTRVLFDVDTPDVLDTLTLRMKYNDGFTAYLNGQPVASRNAPQSPGWNATATTERTVGDSVTPEDISITASLDALVAGTNVLAIHGMNVRADDGDFLLHAQLLATHVDKVQRYFATP
ncbi:MAG: lamin tail domain-containing protein, partial [Thermoguttaceae bacterium]